MIFYHDLSKKLATLIKKLSFIVITQIAFFSQHLYWNFIDLDFF